VQIISPRNIFTYLKETAEGEGLINGTAMTIEKARWCGRIKFTPLTLKFADWLYFFNKPSANPLGRYTDHISALQHGRVYLSRGAEGQHHHVALLSQTPAGSATIVIHFISPLWRLK
jgi:hypothetical protein